MAEKTFRIYFVRHETGNITGLLMRRAFGFFRPAPITAFGPNEDVVREHLSAELKLRGDQINISDYLWDEKFATRKVRIDVRPATTIGPTWVVGKQTVPIRMTYAWSELEKGAFRVMLPRYDWWLLVEDLADAGEILKQIVASSLLGEQSKWVFDFREQTNEWVEEWKSDFDRSPPKWDFGVEETPLQNLASVSEDWVDRAKKLPKTVYRQDDGGLLDLSWAIPPASAVLVGASGVGKTTMIQRLAITLSKRDKTVGHVPHIHATDSERIIAGMAYLGQWEQRCLDIVAELRHRGDWLYVGRLEDFIAERSGGTSVADMFYPALREGTISILAETTPESWARCQREAPSLCAALQMVKVEPAPASEVPRLIQQYLHLKKVTWYLHSESMSRIIRFLSTFEPRTAYPGKAFQFLDWFIQDVGTKSKGAVIDPKEMTAAFSKRSGLPEKLLADEVRIGREEIAAELAERVIGQDQACSEASLVIARLKAGMNDTEKPCGSLFFVGPTGVGKTQLAKEMARYMFGDPNRMIRIDMSEYQTAHSVGRLIDTSRGSESLAANVSSQPLTLVLFDEIEKAHPAVFDLLFGVLGEGRLTDDRGRFVDFRMSVIVMTSNIGVAKKPAVGFGQESATTDTSAARKFFRPEFFNRLDVVVPFSTLDESSLHKICRLMIDRVRQRSGITERRLTIEVSDDAIVELSNRGWDPQRGARPLARVIEEQLVTPLAIEMARDPSLHDTTFLLDLDDDSLQLNRR